MLSSLHEKVVFTRCSCLFNGRPDSAPGPRDLFISVSARATFEVVETIPSKNQMRVRVDESGKDDFPASVDNFCIARLFFDLIAGGDDVDSAVTNQHSALGNDYQLR